MQWNKTVQVVTGGAGGMGLAICKRIANRGPLFVVDNDKEKLENAKILLSKAGVDDAEYIHCDISDKAQVEALADSVQRAGNLGTCIHTAAYAPIQQPAQRIIEVNAVGTVNVLDTFFQLMFNGSSMITMTSIAGHMYSVDQDTEVVYDDAHSPEFINRMLELSFHEGGLAYCVSKAFCMYYTKQSTMRYAQKGARIMTVSAGVFTTPMGLADMPGGVPISTAAPLSRWGHPDEIAAVVEFLSSDNASYITGTDLLIDGGYFAAQNFKQHEQIL